MKKLSSLLALLLMFSLAANAQQFKKKLSNSAGNKVEITLSRSSFHIQGYNGNQILITAEGYKPPPAQAKGLHALYNSAVDNTGIGLSVKEDNGTVHIIKASHDDIHYTVKLPSKVALTVNQARWGGDGIHISNMDGELDVHSKDSNVELKNISGPVIANSTSGNITVVFNSLNQSKPTSISDVSGNVDITLPPASKVNFQLRSITGEIYTDFNMKTKSEKKNGMQQLGFGNTIRSDINGGGVDMNLKSISGNIYIRKKK